MSQYDAGGSAPRVNTPRPNPPRKKPSGDADWGSWLLIAIMFATGLWPIGLFGGFGSFPITLQAQATGKSEVYWK